MLNDEQAKKALKKLRVKGRDKEFLKKVKRSKGGLQKVGLTLLGIKEDGKPLNYWQSEEEYEEAGKLIDKMSPAQRGKFFKMMFPQLAPHVLRGWELLKDLPFQRGYQRKAIRLPGEEERTRVERVRWLRQIHEVTASYDQGIVWVATWHMHLATWFGNDLGILYAAAIDGGGSESDQLMELFKDAAAGEHEIATMGQHIPVAMLTCSRPEAWEFIEKLLLAAQRQEGLRQSVLEAVDLAHPEAFRRMLALILEKNLIRFSSVVRAADVWFGLQWDSASASVVKASIACVVDFLGDEKARLKALNGEVAEAAYLALWCSAARDARVAVKEAATLLGHKQVETRFAAAIALERMGIREAEEVLERALEDEDLRVGSVALTYFAHGASVQRFDELVPLFARHPDKVTKLPALVWPWMELAVGKPIVADALLNNIGKRPISVILPYMDYLGTYARARVAGALRERKNQSEEGRAILIRLLKDASPGVREEAVRGVAKFRSLSDNELLFIESLMTRRSSDLRRGLLQIMASQKGGQGLKSAGRLLQSRNAQQRVGGLELIRSLVESDKGADACLEMVRKFERSAKKLSDAEKTQIDAITRVEEEEVSFSDGLGMMDPSNLTASIPPVARKFKLATKAAVSVIEELEALIHENRKAEITVTEWDDKPTTLQLGNAGYGFATPETDRPAGEQVEHWPFRELWENWLVERPKSKRDSDDLELFRALVLLKVGVGEEVENEDNEGSDAEGDGDDEEDEDDDVSAVSGWSAIAQMMSGRNPFAESLPDWKRKAHEKVYGKLPRLKLRYAGLIEYVLRWFIELDPRPAMADLVLDIAETELSAIPLHAVVEREVDSWGFGFLGQEEKAKKKKKPEKRPLVHWKEWRDWCNSILSCFESLDSYQLFCRSGWAEKHDLRRFELERWLDVPTEAKPKGHPVPVEGADRSRVAPQLFLKGCAAGLANDDDVLDYLVGPRGVSTWGGESFDGLTLGTARKPQPWLKADERFLTLAARCRDRILELELQRGEEPTKVTPAASSISSVPGSDHFFAILKAIGKGSLSRTYSYHNESKNVVLSELLRRTYPISEDNQSKFNSRAAEAGIPEVRLIQVALFAPQWAKLIEGNLGWKGLCEGVWWIHAHTKDTHWSVDQDIRAEWEAQISERTGLSGEDLVDGAVDVNWFGSVYHLLKKTRWEKLLKEARFASGGTGHKRAEVFGQAMLGALKKSDMVKRITDKRHQDTVRALGLLPLAKGKGRDADLLRRYQVFQEFIRTSRKFGSQRQASEKRAALIGQENLARTAGFVDPIRLQWAMEAQEIADLSHGFLKAKAGEVEVTLEIGNWGEVSLSVEKNGKRLKSVPAAARKDKMVKKLTERKTALKRQASRSRKSLEVMMCRGDSITGSELADLMAHPLLAPMLRGLVLTGDHGLIGYPVESGKCLEDHDGKREVVSPGDELRIAHPHDLFSLGNWHQWQKDCFARERIQPFKQVFREYYPLTSDEKKGEGLSRRYAGHQVNPSQAMALFGGRGWIAAPEEGVRLTDHKENVSAYVEFEESFFTPAEVEGLTLEGVRFVKRGTWDTISAPDVAPRLFSEVMRDIDLVVSVAHRGGVDPEASASTVEMRSQLLAETTAVLGLKNVLIEGTHAQINGQYAEYSVHLGSAVAHVNPGGALFIVPVHAQHRGRLFLPFADDDPKTAEVLSKVLLLARDKEIQDPSILAQIQSLKS